MSSRPVVSKATTGTQTSTIAYSPDILPPTFHNGSIPGVYKDQTIFLTGATGFVGKVILEKILRTLPDIKRIFVMVRPKRGQTPRDRLFSEVLSSQIFVTLRSQRDNFDQWCDEKIVAVAGELTSHEVGLSKDDYQRLSDEVSIIIHCAAVVDFNERIDRAIELNTLGSLRMLELGRKCKHIASFVHVSTAYVNSNRDDKHLEEKLYPLGFDPEEMIEKVSKLSNSELDTIISTGILGSWPNTYTMTKAMAESLLVKYRGHVPLVIVRPSIVGSAYTEPVPGWVDVISAAGAVYVAMGMGVVRFLEGSPLKVGDVIPVDYVSNTIIVAAAIVAHKPQTYFVCHAASSSENPMHWGYPTKIVKDFFRENPPPRAIAKPSFDFARSPQLYQLRFFIEYSIPSALLNTLALTGNPDYKKKAMLFQKLLWQTRVITEAFKHFVLNEWFFDNRNVRSMYSMLSPHDQELFPITLHDLDWSRYSELFSYGLCKYTLKMPNLLAHARDARYVSITKEAWVPRHDTYRYRLLPNYARIQDIYIKRYINNQMYPLPPPPSQLKQLVLNSSQVIKAIDVESTYNAKNASSKKKKSNGGSGVVQLTPLEEAQKRAKNIVDEMFADQDPGVIAPLAFVFRKIWSQVYDNVKVSQCNISLIQEAAHNGPIIYIPTHRSYVDFLLLSYVAFMLDLPLPHIVAGEDFLGIMAVRWLFRKSGAFFMKRSFTNDKLYSSILQSYIDELLVSGQSIEFFIEGTRSRSGKMLQPKMGLLSKIINSIERGIINDVTIVPVSLNYEKTMESFLYANELSGESKVKESLSAVVRARSVINSNFGSTTITFAKPFSLNDWKKQHIMSMIKPLELPPTNSMISPFDYALYNQRKIYKHVEDAIEKRLRLQGSIESANILAQQSETSHCQTTATGQWLTYMSKSGNDTTTTATTTDNNTDYNTTATASTPIIYNPNTITGHKLYYTRSLAHNIVYTLNTTNEIFGTHIISTIFLQYRTGIPSTRLTEYVIWVIGQVKQRGGYIYGLETRRIAAFIEDGIKSLGSDLVHMTRRNNIYEPQVTTREQYSNLLVLGQYKNKIIHFFYYEALCAVVIYALQQDIMRLQQSTSSSADSNTSTRNGIPIDAIITKVNFLHSFLASEFITTANQDTTLNVSDILDNMVKSHILQIDTQHNTIYIDDANGGEQPFSFLCSLLWPSIDSLYSLSMYLYSVINSSSTKDNMVVQSQWYANTLYSDSMICFYESCSKDTLENFVSVFKELSILIPCIKDNNNNNTIKQQQYMSALMSSSPNELLQLSSSYNNDITLGALVDEIASLRKQPPVLTRTHFVTTHGNYTTRKTLAIDLPMLAKEPKKQNNHTL